MTITLLCCINSSFNPPQQYFLFVRVCMLINSALSDGPCEIQKIRAMRNLVACDFSFFGVSPVKSRNYFFSCRFPELFSPERVKCSGGSLRPRKSHKLVSVSRMRTMGLCNVSRCPIKSYRWNSTKSFL